MKKNQVNAILVDQTKRRNKVISYACVLFILTFIVMSFVCLFLTNIVVSPILRAPVILLDPITNIPYLNWQDINIVTEDKTIINIVVHTISLFLSL